MGVNSVGIIAILGMSYITIHIVKTDTSVVKIAITFSPCGLQKFCRNSCGILTDILLIFDISSKTADYGINFLGYKTSSPRIVTGSVIRSNFIHIYHFSHVFHHRSRSYGHIAYLHIYGFVHATFAK